MKAWAVWLYTIVEHLVNIVCSTKYTYLKIQYRWWRKFYIWMEIAVDNCLSGMVLRYR